MRKKTLFENFTLPKRLCLQIKELNLLSEKSLIKRH